MSQPLAAKVRYTEIFGLLATLDTLRPDQTIGSHNGHDLRIIRQCFVEEFCHLADMRIAYSEAVIHYSPRHVNFYEVGCECTHPKPAITEAPTSKPN